MDFLTWTEGFALGAGLIIAIGAQNAFVLRLGIQRRHVFVGALFCALSDLALITAGVFGLGSLVRGQSWFLAVMTWGGAAFLTWYGVRAALRALKPGALDEGQSSAQGLGSTLASLAAFTFLNPHVYLDTVVLLGGLGARHGDPGRFWFAFGAASASLVWFFGLAYGARLLAPLFRKPVTWRVLDLIIAAVMFTIAGSLVWAALSHGN
jgi:L-lysine exporter family protein LysE/ArgO